MIEGLHKSVAGALVQNSRMTVVSNNIANANTNGFKKEIALFHARLPEPLENPEVRVRSNMYKTNLGGGVYMSDAWTDHESAGPVELTNNPMDMMIEGNGYFKVINENGEAFYKRGGHFRLNTEGYVTDESGKYFLTNARDNKIFAGPGATLFFDDDANIMINGEPVDKLKLVSFDTQDLDWLKKRGDNMMQPIRNIEEKAFQGDLYVGRLEGSNVKHMDEMVEMIQTQRNYELNMKLITMQDQTLERAIAQVGSIQV